MISLILWFLLRILTSVIAGVVSSLKPSLPLEMSIPLLPPSSPIALWLYRVFISPWIRWDVEWYQRIVAQGYSAVDGTAQFHPLYPWIATPLAKLGVSHVLSLLIVSSLAGIALFYFFFKLARMDLSKNDATFALMIFAFFPLSFVLFAPYSEALFLFLSVLCIFFSRLNKWWLAGIFGGLASLTRQQGVFLLIPIAWELWEYNARQFRYNLLKWRDWLSLVLIPLGYLVWIIYRSLFLADVQVKWDNFQGFLYSFLISPSASEVVDIQKFIWPWQAIYHAISNLLTHPDIDIWVNLIVALLFLVLVAISWKRLRISYRIYVLIITVISFCYYTGPVHPYMGLPRHLYLAFPVFIGFGGMIKKPWIRLLILGASIIGILFMLTVFVLGSWVP